jgi:hypothetical protein
LIPQINELLEPTPDFSEEGEDLVAPLDDWPLALADVLAEALDDAYADADPEELDEALANVLDSMMPAEALNFAKALNQIGTGARKALSDPLVGQIVRTALPIAAGAAGTLIGGPAGTAVGSALGNAAVSALPGAPKPRPTARAQTPARPVAGGSAAAAQGLVLTQQPDVLKALTAVAMGQHGQKQVNGVPTAQILSMLSSVIGRAAADADELMYLDAEEFADADVAYDAADEGSLYAALIQAETAEIAEAISS